MCTFLHISFPFLLKCYSVQGSVHCYRLRASAKSYQVRRPHFQLHDLGSCCSFSLEYLTLLNFPRQLCALWPQVKEPPAGGQYAVILFILLSCDLQAADTSSIINRHIITVFHNYSFKTLSWLISECMLELTVILSTYSHMIKDALFHMLLQQVILFILRMSDD